MQLLDNRIVISATDLNNHLACEHLTTLSLKALSGEAQTPNERAEQAELLGKLGDEHEQRYRERLQAEGKQITEIARPHGLDGIRRAAAETEAAMNRGDEIIYQATFFDGETLGHADFLSKIPTALHGGRWAWHYEVEDTKLALQSEPYFLLQLSFYSEHVARIQGAAPVNMHVILGDKTRETFRTEDFAAYYRSVRKRFRQRLADRLAESYPAPVPHCSICVWKTTCEQQRERDDHLSLVANMTRLQTARLNASCIGTLRALAGAGDDAKPSKMSQSTFDKLRRQARLQERQRLALACGDADPYQYELIESGIRRNNSAEKEGLPTKPLGFYRLPEPSPGDVFFDMEGDPLYEIGKGLEYLFGATTPDRAFSTFWGCDRSTEPAGNSETKRGDEGDPDPSRNGNSAPARNGNPGRFNDRLAEKLAFEGFIDFAMARRTQHPDMHIYHYASYEKSALQKLTLRHASREVEVDLLLKENRLVDLYSIVRQAIVVGQPGYSIKLMEAFYGKRGDASSVKAGDESILRFEEWRALRGDVTRRDDTILDDLALYNRYDCESTLDLRDWLLTLRARAEREFAVAIPPYTGEVLEEKKREEPYLELKAALDERIPETFDPAEDDPASPVRPFFLARHMLEYHWREDKPVYWGFYDRCERYQDDPESLRDDAESIVGLTFVGEPKRHARSYVHECIFPAQMHKLKPTQCYDLTSREAAGEIVLIEDGETQGRLVLRRGPTLGAKPLPLAITLCEIYNSDAILGALARFAQALLDDGDRCRYRAAFDVLRSAKPRLRGRPYGTIIQPEISDERALRETCDALDESYLFVQGPPGSGKTYLGARLIVELIRRGCKIGVASNSHKAVHNLLDEIEKVAEERDVSFVGLKKASAKDEGSHYDSAHITSEEGALDVQGVDLLAGAIRAFVPEGMDQQLDYLFIDEAGQVALPNAIAMMTSAKNVVFLGDPLQLEQVAQTQHPCDLGASVLKHLLGPELRPVASDRGILLTDSYRMHPDVCAFISELLYEGRLHAAPGRERQEVMSSGLTGTGLRYLPVRHDGNTQRSEEEAERIATEIAHLLGSRTSRNAADVDQRIGGSVRDFEGKERSLGQSDIIVVTPYNAQVRCIRRVLDKRGWEDIQVGTVDKFQGREAYVVFFSTAASSSEDAPRGTSFIFDRQRFNVAISRARALAVMVGSPNLHDQHCTTIDQVRIANALFRFLEDSGYESDAPYGPGA